MKSRMPMIPSSDGGMGLAYALQDSILSRVALTSKHSITDRMEDMASIESYLRLGCIPLKARSA